MNHLFLNILGFIACAGVIIYSGARLSFYGDKIAELTGMGRAWAGLILMASVTTLPELITNFSAVVIIEAPDLAAGNIFGSCAFNLLILSLLDARLKKPLLSTVKSAHVVAAIFGIILLSVSGIAMFLAQEIPSVLWVSSFTFIIFGIYLIAIWGIFKYEKTTFAATPAAPLATSSSDSDKAVLKRTIGQYALYAFIVIGAALFLPYFGEHIALKTGLGNSFFGTLFMAASTSLPELVVCLAALRMGAADLAVGNLLGANVFNMCILALSDVFYLKGSIFQTISLSHLLSVFITIIMTALVGMGLLFKPEKKHAWLLSIDTFIILILYLALITFLFIKK